MLQTLALALRDVGFVLYGGPLVAFAVLVGLRAHLVSANGVEIFRAYRAWGPGLGLSLGATVFGGLGAHYLEHGAFAWSLERPAELLGWLTFFAMWVSNIKLEVWTLEPLRKLDRERGLTDEAAFEAATAPVARHLLIHAALVLAVVVLARLAA